MQIDKETIQSIAGLARLKFTDAEAVGLAKELQHILECLESIEQEDLEGLNQSSEVPE